MEEQIAMRRIRLSGAGGGGERAALACAVGSWICHDLASPLGAMAGSLDLLEMPDPLLQAEARAILRDAVEELMQRLAYDRIAFGRSGMAPLPPGEAGEKAGDAPGPRNAPEEPAVPLSLGGERAAPSGGRAAEPGAAGRHEIPEAGVSSRPSPAGIQPLAREEETEARRGGRADRVSAREMRRLLEARFGRRHAIALETEADIPRPEARRLLLACLAIAPLARGGTPIRAFRKEEGWCLDFVPTDRARQILATFSWARIDHPAAALLAEETVA